jgi:hypothetical protein
MLLTDLAGDVACDSPVAWVVGQALQNVALTTLLCVDLVQVTTLLADYSPKAGAAAQAAVAELQQQVNSQGAAVKQVRPEYILVFFPTASGSFCPWQGQTSCCTLQTMS